MMRAIRTQVLGASLARAIGLLSLPVISRIYEPSEVGAYAVYIAVLSIVAPVSSLRYVTAVPLPRSRRRAISLIALSGIASFSVLVLLGAAAAVAISAFPSMVDQGLYVIPLLFAGCLLAAAYEAIQMWAVRIRAHSEIAKSQVVQSWSGEGAKVLLGLLGFGGFGLVAGSLVGSLMGLTRIARRLRKSAYGYRSALRLGLAVSSAKKFREFPLARLPSQLILVINNSAPLMFVVAAFGITDSGHFSLASTVVLVPVSVVANAVGNAFFSEAASLGVSHKDQIISKANALQRRLAWLAIPAAFIALLAAPQVFKTVFGQEWAIAGRFAGIIAISAAFQVVSAPVAHVITVLGRQATYLKLNLVRLVLLVGGFGASVLLGLELIEFVWLYTMLSSAHYLWVWSVLSRSRY